MAQSSLHVRFLANAQMEVPSFSPVPARSSRMLVPGKCTPSSHMTAGITSLR